MKTSASTQPESARPVEDEDIRPLWAPSRELDNTAPLRWLNKGWQDFRAAPVLSLTYGLIMTIFCVGIAAIAYQVGSLTMVIIMMAGFMFIGPAMAMGLYTLSCQLEKGIPPLMLSCLRQGKKRMGNQMIFAFALLIVFLVWARAASMVHIFIPMTASPPLSEIFLFLGIGCVVGTLFATVIFCASAFSLPMMLDRDVDAITAMLTSVNAVLHNKKAMLLWAMIIGGSMLLGLLTLFLGLAVILPVIGHATWHGYRETVIGDDWPQDPYTRIA